MKEASKKDPRNLGIVRLDEGVSGFIMVEQVKSIDFRSRKAKRVGKAPAEILEEVLSILDACIY